MGRDQEVTARVVDGSLHSSVNTAHGQSIWLVEVGYWSVVLQFPVLDHDLRIRPVAVHGQARAATALPGIPQQPVETVLASTSVTEDLIAEAQDVCLVAGLPSHGREASGYTPPVRSATTSMVVEGGPMMIS